MISERTKRALRAVRARGQKLGNPRLKEAARIGTEATKEGAQKFVANVVALIKEIQKEGISSRAAIAAKLNERKVATARGGRWSHVQVGAVLARAN